MSTKFDLLVATYNNGHKRIIIREQGSEFTGPVARFNGQQKLIDKTRYSRHDKPFNPVRKKTGEGLNLHYKKGRFVTYFLQTIQWGQREKLNIRHPATNLNIPLGSLQYKYFPFPNNHARSQFPSITSGGATASSNQFDVRWFPGVHCFDACSSIYIHNPYVSSGNYITSLVEIGSFSLSDEKEVDCSKSTSLAQNFISMLNTAKGDDMKEVLKKINSARKDEIQNAIIDALHTSKAKRIFMNNSYPLDLYKHLFESLGFDFEQSKHYNLDTDKHLTEYIGSTDGVVRSPAYYIQKYDDLKRAGFFPPHRYQGLDEKLGIIFTRLHRDILKYFYTNIFIIQEGVWARESRSDFMETDLYKDLVKLFEQEFKYTAKRSLAKIVSWTNQNPNLRAYLMPQRAVEQEGAGATGAASPHPSAPLIPQRAAEQEGAGAAITTPHPSAPLMPQCATEQSGLAADGDGRDQSSATLFASKPTVRQEGSRSGVDRTAVRGAGDPVSTFRVS